LGKKILTSCLPLSSRSYLSPSSHSHPFRKDSSVLQPVSAPSLAFLESLQLPAKVPFLRPFYRRSKTLRFRVIGKDAAHDIFGVVRDGLVLVPRPNIPDDNAIVDEIIDGDISELRSGVAVKDRPNANARTLPVIFAA